MSLRKDANEKLYVCSLIIVLLFVSVRQRVLNKQTHEVKLGQKIVKIAVCLPPSEASVPQVSIQCNI